MWGWVSEDSSGGDVPRTLLSELSRVFPNGTGAEKDPTKFAKSSEETAYSMAPIFPPDVFAGMAHLLKISGGYRCVVAGEDSCSGPAACVVVTERDVQKLRKVAAKWRDEEPIIPDEIQNLWDQVLGCHDYQISNLMHDGQIAPWILPAYKLVIAADEACIGVGILSNGPESWVEQAVVRILGSKRLPPDGSRGISDRHERIYEHLPSVTSHLVDDDVVCVQPKSRTPDVGISMRNISHNVALLPSQGEIRIHWVTAPEPQPSETHTDLNLLLIPYPFEIEPDYFAGAVMESAGVESHWGWFELQQIWLKDGPARITNLIKSIILRASEKEKVHGVILPEYALDFATYEQIAKMIRDDFESVQFLVSGTSSNCAGGAGNYALATHFFAGKDPSDFSRRIRLMGTTSRAKHHRWSLEHSQISKYGIESAFPNIDVGWRWWEKIDIEQREIHINAFREKSFFSVMICEDLARSDPAHDPLRAIGPNIIFVLLMDGVQEEWRWAARYSTALADDPGSSVLALTSRALVNLENRKLPDDKKSWKIAIWKDEGSRVSEISCTPDASGVLLRLKSNRKIEATLDGRRNRENFSWQLNNEPEQIILE